MQPSNPLTIYYSMLPTVMVLCGCLQAASSPCDNGGVCDPGLRCGMAGATQICVAASCGNGQIDPGEACDDGNNISGDGCPADCHAACGDGLIDPGEACDDGNAINGDGCDSNCTVTACGNGIVTSGEVCDDGNAIDGDGCDSNCTVTGCGNGVVTSGEDCDDGNTTNGDGCEHDCTLSCFPQPPTLVTSPSSISEAPSGVPTMIDVAFTNNNPAPCEPISFQLEAHLATNVPQNGLSLDPPAFAIVWSAPVPSESTTHLTLAATPAETVAPGTRYDIEVHTRAPTGAGGFDFLNFKTVTLTVGEPAGYHVSTARELMFKALSDIAYPTQTAFDPSSNDPQNGVGTFKHLTGEFVSDPETRQNRDFDALAHRGADLKPLACPSAPTRLLK